MSSTRTLSGILEPIISGQIVNSFGQGKRTSDCQSGNFKNYSFGNHVSTRSRMFRMEKLINSNMTCMWTFHTNSLNAKKSLQILDFQRLASLEYVLQQVLNNKYFFVNYQHLLVIFIALLMTHFTSNYHDTYY